jgi:hypothetical protein
MRRFAFLIVIMLTALRPAYADCVARSNASTAHLIELYTSEGCSSCPPAERWLGGLRENPNVVALEFHVDYWDSLGWRDRFADPRYTARQHALATRGGSGIVYTPEVALDGREWRDWYRGSQPPSAAAAPFALELRVKAANPLTVSLDVESASGTDPSAYRSYFAITEDGLSSDVKAGENRGATLRHQHVVRALDGPLPFGHAQVVLVPPADMNPEQAAVIAFVTDARDGGIVQVLSLSPASCVKEL